MNSAISRRPLILVVAALVLVGLQVPVERRAHAQSDKPEESEESEELTDAEQKKFDKLVKQGRKAYSNEEWDKALKNFEKAYSIKKSSNLLFNMGLTCEKSGNLGKAVNYYEKFVSAPGISLDMRKKVQKRLEVLRPIVQNEEREKRAEQEKMPEDQGLQKSTDKEKSEEQAVDEPAGKPTEDGGSGGTSALPKILVASGGASLLASGGLLLAAQSNKNNFETGDSPSARRQARQWHVTNTYLADGLLIAGTGLATTGLIMWLSGGSSQDGQSAEANRPTIAPAVSARGVGVNITGSF